MIITFKCTETEKIFERRIYKKFPRNLQQRSRKKLLILDSASHLDDLRIPPANRLEDRKGQHSIRINDQWRICFVWKDENSYDVEIVDYH